MKQQIVSQNVGLWIDHKEAFVVFSHDKKAESQPVTSELEKHVRFSEHLSETGGLLTTNATHNSTFILTAIMMK